MPRTCNLSLPFFVAVLLVVSLTSCHRSITYQQEDFEVFSSLEGGWKTVGTDVEIYEEWKRESDQLFAAQVYRIALEDTFHLEQIQLRLKDGEIHYSPKVLNQNEGQRIHFKLVEKEENNFLFSNPEHDFPKGIRYQFTSEDSITVNLYAEKSKPQHSISMIRVL